MKRKIFLLTGFTLAFFWKDVILKEKEVDSVKNISADSVVKAYDLNPLDAVRLDGDGEKAVIVLKKYILKELENI